MSHLSKYTHEKVLSSVEGTFTGASSYTINIPDNEFVKDDKFIKTGVVKIQLYIIVENSIDEDESYNLTFNPGSDADTINFGINYSSGKKSYTYTLIKDVVFGDDISFEVSSTGSTVFTILSSVCLVEAI